jgi:biotin operon repressor
MMATKHDLMAAMVYCTGRNKGISCKKLAQRLDVPERQVRHLVTELRDDGIAICGHPSTGYYVASSPEDVQETIEFLKDRAMHSLKLASTLSKVPLPDLLGQLHLKT